jgi:hypothetical protein
MIRSGFWSCQPAEAERGCKATLRGRLDCKSTLQVNAAECVEQVSLQQPVARFRESVVKVLLSRVHSPSRWTEPGPYGFNDRERAGASIDRCVKRFGISRRESPITALSTTVGPRRTHKIRARMSEPERSAEDFPLMPTCAERGVEHPSLICRTRRRWP